MHLAALGTARSRSQLSDAQNIQPYRIKEALWPGAAVRKVHPLTTTHVREIGAYDVEYALQSELKGRDHK